MIGPGSNQSSPIAIDAYNKFCAQTRARHCLRREGLSSQRRPVRIQLLRSSDRAMPMPGPSICFSQLQPNPLRHPTNNQLMTSLAYVPAQTEHTALPVVELHIWPVLMAFYARVFYRTHIPHMST